MVLVAVTMSGGWLAGLILVPAIVAYIAGFVSGRRSGSYSAHTSISPEPDFGPVKFEDPLVEMTASETISDLRSALAECEYERDQLRTEIAQLRRRE